MHTLHWHQEDLKPCSFHLGPSHTCYISFFVFQNRDNAQNEQRKSITLQEMVTNECRRTALSLKGVVNPDAYTGLARRADLSLISLVWINMGTVKVKWCSVACCSCTACFRVNDMDTILQPLFRSVLVVCLVWRGSIVRITLRHENLL